MNRYIFYFWYVVRHKWYVAIECFKRGLIWRGLIHDIDKFYPNEFFTYARFFYEKDGSPKQRRDKTGYYKPTDTGNREFDMAWFLHQAKNDHHWQWHVFPDDGPAAKTDTKLINPIKVLPMSRKAIIEMICDWKGAGKAQGSSGVVDWYEKNKDKLILHPETREIVEREIDIIRLS
jgi:hypothetical protein